MPARALLSLVAGAAALALLFASCGDDDDSTTGGGSSANATKATGQTPGGSAGGGNSISGQLQLSGKLSGAFDWNKDLALSCYPQAVEVTMSDGKDTFIAVTAKKTVAVSGIKGGTTLTSGKLTGVFQGAEASFDTKAPSGNPLGATGSISFNGLQVKNDAGDAVTLNGKLTLDCK